MRILATPIFLLALSATSPAAIGEASVAEKLGYRPDAKLLIVHADDLGLSHSVNRAFADAYRMGAVRSGSMMVPAPWFPEIAAWYRRHPEADLGLHLTLNSEWKFLRWRPVLPRREVPSLVDAEGFLHADRSSVERAEVAEVEAELRAQVERALAFGIHPTHLDSHMGVLYETPELLNAYLRVADDYRLPVLLPERLEAGGPGKHLRLQSNRYWVDTTVQAYPDVPPDRWTGFYHQAIRQLMPGVTQFIVHLAYADSEMKAVTVDRPDWGAEWRQRDFDFFTSRLFRRLLRRHDVRLVTWREIGELMSQ